MKAACAVVVFLAALTGCGGGTNGSNGSSNFAGDWQMTLQRSDTGTLKTESGFMVQSGGVVTGNFLLTGDTLCSGVGAAQGQVNGANVSISVNQVGQTITLAGALGTNGSITGTYTILASPCGSTQTGTLTATPVKDLNGSVQGVFTSLTSGAYQATGKVAQAVNTGASSANLSGSLTSSNAPCFTSITVSGSISGTSVVFNLLSVEGLAVGQFHGTISADGKSITGPFDFENNLPPPLRGCQDSGTAVFTLGS